MLCPLTSDARPIPAAGAASRGHGASASGACVPLAQKYAPTRSDDVCVNPASLRDLREACSANRCLAIQSEHGSGATLAAHLVCAELGYDVVYYSGIIMGTSQIVSALRQRTRNILKAFHCEHRISVVFIKDYTSLPKNERSRLLGFFVEHADLHCIVFLGPANAGLTGVWRTIVVTAAPIEMRANCLRRIASAENISVSNEVLHSLAQMEDLRHAINTLGQCTSQTARVTARDYASLDDYTMMLCAYETIRFASIEDTAEFLDLQCAVDTMQHRTTAYDIGEVVRLYVGRCASFAPRQTFVARNAQLRYRMAVLSHACAIANVCQPWMSMYSVIFKHYIDKGIYPLRQTSQQTWEEHAKALYTIAKINESSSACKTLKRKIYAMQALAVRTLASAYARPACPRAEGTDDARAVSA